MDPGHAPNQPQPRLQTHPNSAWPRPGQILFRPSSQPGILVLPWLRPEPGPAPKGSADIATPIDLVLLKLHPFEGCGYNEFPCLGPALSMATPPSQSYFGCEHAHILGPSVLATPTQPTLTLASLFPPHPRASAETL